MSKSKARKQRERLIREGRRNPLDDRGSYALIDLRTRKTKTKAEKLNQQKHKGRLSDLQHPDKRPLCV
ncbi:uracil phosphoribosyltransferase [Fictibacillus sp. NRS-1165]|uniref:uracil phosphoribosyltransferase n=1 Tax=Fictibacillus sp. NRS-1165 TaxID=3144463 RepID=UPI003D1F1F1F